MIKKRFLYLFVFFLIYIEFGYRMTVTNQVPGYIRMLIILGLCLILIMFYPIKKISKASLLLIAYFMLVVFLNLLRDSTIENSILLAIPIMVGFIIANAIDLKLLSKVFCNIMFFLAIYSVAFFLLGIITPGLIQALPMIGFRSIYSAEVHDALFTICLTNAERMRNYGIAWEPGAFSLLLCAALYCENYINDDISSKRMLGYVAAIITTFSTMGYFVLALIFCSIVFNRNDRSKVIRTIVVVLSLALLFVGFFIIPDYINDLVFSKLNNMFSSGAQVAYTTQARLDAITYPLKAFLSSPLYGVGYDEFADINATYCNSVATNTIINWFALSGILLGIPCTLYYFKFIKLTTPKNEHISKFFLVLAAIILVSTESLLRISFLYILIFYSTNSHLSIKSRMVHDNENSFYSRSI